MIRKWTLITSLSISSFMLGTYYDRYAQTNVENTFYSNKIYARSLAVPFDDDLLKPINENTWNSNLSEIMKFGFPSFDNLRLFHDYVLSYDRRNHIANWVFERINTDTIGHNKLVDRSKSEFKSDPNIHEYFRSLNSDYHRSGYDRGHLAAAGNHKQSQQHLDDTFYLSNIAPQVGKGFNRGKWNDLEKYVRKLAKIYQNIYCCTGPLFLPYHENDGKTFIKYEVIGKNFVAVPTHFFKIIFCENNDGSVDIEAYVLPNTEIPDNSPLEIYQVPPESIERASGLLIIDKIPPKMIKSINKKSI